MCVVWTIVAMSMAAQCEPVELGSLAGGTSGIDVSGDYAYSVQTYGGMYVYDVTEPTPQRVGVLGLPALSRGVDVVGGYAFTGGSDGEDDGSLHVIDVSTPTSPTLVSTTPIAGNVYGVTVAGDLAFVYGEGGVHMLDVADPASPAFIEQIDMALVRHVHVDGDLAFLAAQSDGLQIFDVSDPAAPVQVGSYETGTNFFGVDVVDNVAFVASYNSNLLELVDVTNPARPALISSWFLPGQTAHVVVSDDVAYVTTDVGGLYAVDVSDVTTPIQIDLLPFARTPAIAGDRAYAIHEGIRAVDISDPSDMTVIGEAPQLVRPGAVALLDGVAHVADRTGGYRMVDVTDPGDMHVSSIYEPAGGTQRRDILVRDGLIYVVGNARGLSIMDPADPTTPLGEVFLSDADRISLNGDHAYVAAGFDDTAIIDIADPASPTLVKSFELESVTNHMLFDGNVAYVAHGTGVIVYDVSDPVVFEQIGQFQTPMFATSLARSGKVLFVATGGGTIWVIDVREPDPTFLDLSVVPHDIKSLSFADDVLYVAAGDGGVVMMDARDPRDLEVITTVATRSEALSAVANDDVLYVAEDGAGLAAHDISTCLVCPADLNKNGTLDILDFVTFQLWWQDDEVGADCNDDGLLDILDFVCFQTLFDQGCP